MIHDARTRDYVVRRIKDGRTPKTEEIRRWFMRHIASSIFPRLLADLHHARLQSP